MSSTESVNISSGIIKVDSEEIPYAHFPYDCNLEEPLSVMIRDWKLHLPKIMLLIISDNGPLRTWDSYKQQEKFVKGLIKGSNATSMWIFTSGLNIGISKIIGDAIQEDYNKRHGQICFRHAKTKVEVTRPPLIGVCCESLLTYDQFETPEKVLKLENTGNNLEEQKFNLNPYHSHFLILEDKTYRKDGSSQFLLQLVDTFRFTKVPETDSEKEFFPASRIPVIAILIQGNLNSIHYILAHLKRKLPLLVIKGSGGLADVFAYVYHEVNRSFLKIKDKEYVETVLRRGLTHVITATFPGLKDNKTAQNLLCGRIIECIECSGPPEMKYITVLNVLDLTCNMEDFPLYLLQALFKSEKSEKTSLHSQLRKDLQLTFDWNCPQIALTKVFYRDHTFVAGNDIFEQALLEKDREPFVSLFIENGFPLHKYLNAARLLKLFQQALKENFFKQVCWQGILGYGEVATLNESFINSDLNWIIESLLGVPIIISAEELNVSSAERFSVSYSKDVAIDVANRRALMILTIWALISNRAQLSIVLWEHADQPIMTALAASLTLDKMKIFINETKTKEDIDEFSKKFASMATGVFDLCYNDMPTKAYDSLNVRVREWAGLSLIDMASLSQNRTFMAHSCCQKWLTNKFMGNIKIRELAWGFMTFPVYIKVILCSFLIFPMYLWVRFKETTIHEFVGEDDYEGNDPYYIPEKKEQRRSTRAGEEGGRTHLLRYHYPPMWQMIFWMWSAPITKFWVSNIFYIIYLVVFSLAVIWPSCGNVYLDIVICIWTALIAVDSTYRMIAIHKAFPNTSLFGSSLEIIYMIFFVIFYFLLRIATIPGFQDPYAGKILICGALICFYYRMIFIYLPISSTLGPLLYRVKAMITIDFVNFMKLVVFILIGNAIAMQAILYPDYPLIPELIHKSFYKAFFSFFLTPVTELAKTDPKCVKWEQKPIDDIMCRVSEYVDGKCSNGIKFWPYVLVFQYMMLLKLILMTVLFALFNATGARIGAEMDSIWKFQRYNLIVNFSYSLRLPPPLNIFSVIFIIYENIVKCAKHGISFVSVKTVKKVTDIKGVKDDLVRNIKGVKDDIVQFLADDKSSQHKYLPSTAYAYWRQLAKDFCDDRDQEKEEDAYMKRELDVLSQLSDDLSMKEILIHRAKAQITQLEADICYTHAHLETLQYRGSKGEIIKPMSLHSLSRESPYPLTKIQRFPVPDKYVPWEVMWLHYEPSVYTMPKEEFPSILQKYADDDILSLQAKGGSETDLPVYLWNLESVDSNGVYRNRKSWITNHKKEPITYRLDMDNLPRNPMGRTGLRGKGALPRWGPNHNVFVVITRWKKKRETDKEESLIETSDHLEFVETWFMKKNELSLLGGFAWSENKYEVIQSCFRMDEDSVPWASSEDMISYFKSHSLAMPNKETTENDFTSRQVYTGYMDDQMNTDQAWKEVELWHIHYNMINNLFKNFKANIRWRLLSEDVFMQLPYGQTTLLQDAIRLLSAKIAHI